ncbi:MAG: DUF3662 and FHA domain-containing protein [Actinomycetes bacterium]
MSVLRSLETRIAGLVEGTFSRAFRSEVRPIEIARRLAREMDQNRVPMVSRVYAPTTYAVFLGPDDYARFEGARADLVSELSAYLLEHARREKVVLTERPRISVDLDERLGLGEFGIRPTPLDKAALAEPGQPAVRTSAPPQPAASIRPVVPPPTPTPAPVPPVPAPAGASLRAGATVIPISSAGAVIGRSSSCEVVLEDPNASRRHAQIRRTAEGWTIEDLGSTNGVRVNGAPASGATRIANGDRIELGHTQLTFESG